MRDAERERDELAKEVDRKAKDVAYLEEKLRAQQAAHIEEFAALRRRKEAELEEAVAEQKRKTEERAALADRGERQLAEAAAAHTQQVGKLTKALLQYKAACKLQREELARIHSAQAAKAMIDLKLGGGIWRRRARSSSGKAVARTHGQHRPPPRAARRFSSSPPGRCPTHPGSPARRAAPACSLGS